MGLYKNTNRRKYGKLYKKIFLVLFLVFFIATGIYAYTVHYKQIHPSGEYGEVQSVETSDLTEDGGSAAGSAQDTILDIVPEYSGTPTYVLNDGKPKFTDEEYERAEEGFIELSELDYLGRCGTCTASLGKDMLDSAGERRDISEYHPSGWNQASYPDIIDEEGGWLYHRSHLIAHMFAGADPNVDGPKNLITGTSYCNEKGMLPYCERAVQNWLIRKANGGRVLYRVTPVFSGMELVPRGVHIEAGDVPTKGTEFHINAYCYNVQPGLIIDYMTGYSTRDVTE